MTSHSHAAAGAICSMVLVVTLLAAACGPSGAAGGAPEVTVAESRAAQLAFRRLHARWISTPVHRRAALSPELDRFLARHGDDPKARIVRLYRAWIDLERGKVDRAARAVSAEQPAGAVGDLGRVVKAAIATRRGEPERALELLEPLRGRIVDADDRSLFAGELVRAALAAGHYRRAVTYMLDWAAQATETNRENVKANIVDQLRRVPPVALERALSDIGEAPADSDPDRAARQWLARSVRQQLVRTALAQNDVALAGRLLDVIPAGLRTDESREALRRLAAQGRVAPRIAGRAVGQVLELAPQVARRRSAEAAAGMARALTLASDEPAPIRLLSRQADGKSRIGAALAGLAGEGAAVLVAGVTAASAGEAAEFAKKFEIPVILLTAPALDLQREGFAFVVGERADADAALLSAELASRGFSPQVSVGPEGQVPCEPSSTSAGAPRFPAHTWRREGVRGLLLLGDPGCSRDVLADVSEHRLDAAIGLGFESATMELPPLGRPLFTIASGRFPPVPKGAAADAPSSWYAALGADAVRLAAAALSDFPEERVKDDEAVRRLHRRARDALATASVVLETSAESGFGGGRKLARDLHVVERDQGGHEP